MSHPLAHVLGSWKGVLAVGAAFGVVAALLQHAGNPSLMGLCTAGFVRDIAGALGMHRDPAAQYLRPEIPALVLGASLAAVAFGEFRSRAGAASAIHFLLGGLTMLGALAFQGCSLRALLRLAGGDLSSLVGLCAFCTGIAAGVWFMRRGFDLGRTYPLARVGGFWPMLVALGLLALLVLGRRDQAPLYFSQRGPGAEHAAVGGSIGAGIFLGFVAQQARFCTMGAFRNVLLMRDFGLTAGVAGLVVAGLVANLLLGQARVAFEATPRGIVGGFLGMALVGLSSTLAGGCPTRQLIHAGEGDGDAAAFLVGMMTSAAIVHNWGLFEACGPGPTDVSVTGIAVLSAGLAVCVVIALGCSPTRSDPCAPPQHGSSLRQ